MIWLSFVHVNLWEADAIYSRVAWKFKCEINPPRRVHCNTNVVTWKRIEGNIGLQFFSPIIKTIYALYKKLKNKQKSLFHI